MKKALSVFLAVVIAVLQIAVAIPFISAPAHAAEINFKCGDNLTWTIDGNNTLIISGTGEMYDVRSEMFEEEPWYDFRYSITSIVIEEGVTSIADGAFGCCYNATRIHIASTVEVIEYDAFYKKIKYVTVGENSMLRQVDSFAFNDTEWYANLPDKQPVYIGRLFYIYKGIPAAGTTLTVKDGTYAVNASACYNRSGIADVILPDSIEHIGANAFLYTTFLSNQPEGPIYRGSSLLGYSGSVPVTQADFVVKDGTKCIAYGAFGESDRIFSLSLPSSLKTIGAAAFYKCTNLKEVNFAEGSELEFVGASAFSGCSALTGFVLPESVKYIGNYAFSTTKIPAMHLSENVSYIGLKFISGNSELVLTLAENNPYLYMDEHCVIYNERKTELLYSLPSAMPKEYTVEKSCEMIRYYTFQSSKVEKINLNDGLKYIAKFAFENSKLKSLSLPDSVEGIAIHAFSGCQISELKLSNRLRTIESFVFCADFALKEVVVPESVTYIASTAFYNCKALEKIIIPASVTRCENAFENCENVTIYCYENSAAHTCAVNNGINYVLLDYLTDTAELTAALEQAQGIDRSLYTEESLALLDEAVNAADTDAEKKTQEQVNAWAAAINDALGKLDYKDADYSEINAAVEAADKIDRNLYTQESLLKLDEALNAVDYSLKITERHKLEQWLSDINEAVQNLEYLPADYSSLDAIKEKCDAIDRSLYTPESLSKLDGALDAVEDNLKIDKQEQVAQYVTAIQQAYDALEYLPADYSLVEEAKERAAALDRRYYTEVSLVLLDNLINSVDYSLNITQQETVNGFAKGINDAIDSLAFAVITLRHDLCGVIVTATTKEIKPDTVLTVEEVDSSSYEGTNFAVGGSIRSLHFYDINLILGTQTVQPDGNVTVKIRIADGVDPKKCKVYHVTDDLVNPLVRFANTIDGNYVVFETDHFSEFAVIEVETVLDSVEVTSLPSKTVYGIGETVDASGLAVKANFSDGTSKAVTDFTVGMVKLDSLGKKKVTVYYTYNGITKTAEFEITVNAENVSVVISSSGKPVERVEKKIGLFSLYSKTKIKLDASVKNADGCRIEWSSDNSKVTVDSDGNLSFRGFFGAKKAVITVRVIDANGNVVAKDSVTVIVYKLSSQLSKYQAQTVDLINRTADMLKQI